MAASSSGGSSTAGMTRPRAWRRPARRSGAFRPGPGWRLRPGLFQHFFTRGPASLRISLAQRRCGAPSQPRLRPGSQASAQPGYARQVPLRASSPIVHSVASTGAKASMVRVASLVGSALRRAAKPMSSLSIAFPLGRRTIRSFSLARPDLMNSRAMSRPGSRRIRSGTPPQLADHHVPGNVTAAGAIPIPSFAM
jgi:hypothetical protein